jgi:hypothetical protein
MRNSAQSRFSRVKLLADYAMPGTFRRYGRKDGGETGFSKNSGVKKIF